MPMPRTFGVTSGYLTISTYSRLPVFGAAVSKVPGLIMEEGEKLE